MNTQKRPTVGLALGSGGARGLSIIGIIKVLEQHGVPIDYIAGSSIGAFVGGLYAAGASVERIEQLALDTNLRTMLYFLDPRLKHGLIGGNKVKSFIRSCVNGMTFEQCKIPFAAIATDVKNGDAVVMKQGDLTAAIRASISVPLIFKPMEIKGRVLADGGLSMPVPVEVVRQMGADIVIAVNLDNHHFKGIRSVSFYRIAENALRIVRHNLAAANVASADVVVNPQVGGTRWHKFNKSKEMIVVGEHAALEVLPQIKKLLAGR